MRLIKRRGCPTASDLADGAKLDVSPESSEISRDEIRLGSLLGGLDVAAPPSLRDAITELISSASPAQRAPRQAKRWAAALASVAAVGVMGVLVLPGGGSSPSVVQAAQLTLRSANIAGPVESATRPARLVRSMAGIAFPDLAYRFGWRSVGARSDTLNGRKTTTVFYVNRAGERIGYEIVGGTPLAVPEGRATHRGGITYRVLEVAGLPLVTWQRAGHTCVLAGRRVDVRTLLALARWSNA
jgi:hypothetical protein